MVLCGNLIDTQMRPLGLCRRPPLSWMLVCSTCVIALTFIIFNPSPTKSLVTIDDSFPLPEIYTSYRRLREQATSEFLEIRSLSLGITPPREIEVCGKEKDNFVPCHNVSKNLLAGFHDGEEYDRHCDLGEPGVNCLIRPPKEYKIPLRWPAGRDIIWSGNVKITKDQFLSSGSMTKRYNIFFLCIGFVTLLLNLMID